MRLVVDASVAVKWFVPHRPTEQDVDKAIADSHLLDRAETKLFAPSHWVLEILAVLARIEPGIVNQALNALEDASPRVIADRRVMQRALDLSVTLDHHLFDTLYHAVALEVGATLVTADKAYFDKAQGLGAIAFLPDFQPPPASA